MIYPSKHNRNDMADLLKLIRMAHGLKGQELAKKLHFSPTHISMVENCQARPSKAFLDAFANLFQMRGSELIKLCNRYSNQGIVKKCYSCQLLWLYQNRGMVVLCDKWANKEGCNVY